MIVKATITYSDSSEATFVGEPLNLVEIPLLSSAQQDALNAPVTETAVEEVAAAAVDEAPVNVPVEEAPVIDEAPSTEAAPAE